MTEFAVNMAGPCGGVRCQREFTQNGVIQPLLTDLYQITMAYAYWKSNKCSDHAVFDLFFRKNPFNGEFTVFAGLDECLKFLKNFHYSESDIVYLKKTLPSTVEENFYVFLSTLTAQDVTMHAIPEGTVVFPRVPLMRVEGPLPVVQLLETTILTLVNYASLVATNAARYRMAAGSSISLLEFGLRRAQGPDGGLSASKYAYIGGFDGTSNVLAGKLYGIPVKGTHAHAFIMSYSSFDDSQSMRMQNRQTGEEVDFVALCWKWQRELSQLLHIMSDEASPGELAAFAAYAVAFPDNFLALVDTYDVLRRRQWTVLLPDNGFSRLRIRSGLLNFSAVALALNELGYRAVGIRIDSGDLAYWSIVARDTFTKIAEHYAIPWFNQLTIIASNDINEDTVISLNEQGHKIDCFGIGTHLVTCQKQPALGCVFKLVEVNLQSCIKLSLDVEKVTIPSKKSAYRLYGQDGYALVDLLQRYDETAPLPGQKVLCRHPFQESKRAYVIPSKVEALMEVHWSNSQISKELPTLNEVKQRVTDSLKTVRSDIKRNLNPTPYKVSVSDELYHFMHELWLQNAPIGELS